MNPYRLHISLYDLAFLGTIFIGLTFALLLAFTKRSGQTANRFLALALAVMVLWMLRMSVMDTWLPQFSLALGPLVYFYVRKLTRREYKFGRRDWLHFIPVLLEQAILLNPVLQLLTFISVITYLYCAHRLIERFYRRQKFSGGDRYRYELRWLHKLLKAFGLLWLLWIPFTIAGYFYYHHQLNLQAYYPFYIGAAMMLIWIAAAAYLRPEAGVPMEVPSFPKPSAPTELKQKGNWLKKAVKEKHYYEDPELSLSSLAEKLGLHTHELSRVLNTVLKKSFNDFINEYRVQEAIRKMQEPSYDHLTLMGIAYDSGFNSKSAFHRIFKEKTGKSPAEYKAYLKKELPSYNLGQHSRFAPVISNYETTPKWSQEKLNRNVMFRNYLKTTLRSLLKNRAYSFLNIAGLAIGVTCASLIFLWAQDELTYDHNFEKHDYLYKVFENQAYQGKTSTFVATPGVLAKALKAEIPGIKNAARMTGASDQQLFALGDKAITEKGNYADPEIFSMLNLPFVSGSGATAFQQLHSVVINQTMAKKFFGDANPMGRSLRMNHMQDYTVTGVFKDLPENSTFQFQWLAPIQNIDHTQPYMTMWNANWVSTVVELGPAASVASVNRQLAHFIAAKTKGDSNPDCFLYAMNDWNLHNNFTDGKMVGGKIEYVKIFSIIAWIILLIACINFMNLSTARSEQRGKEVGVRKVMGAGKGMLIGQFIGEAVIMSFISVLAAVGLIYVAIPYFNNLVQKELAPNIFEPSHILYLVIIGLVTGLLAGSYPAFYLSSFNPIAVLKNNNIKSRFGSGFIRKSLVVIQFSVSIILIIGTVIIYQQIQHIKDRELGFNKNNLVYINLQSDEPAHFAVVYNDLERSGVVENATLSSDPVYAVGNNTDGCSWAGMDAVKPPLISTEFVSPQFVSTMGMKLSAGRDFNTNSSSDSSNVMINESLAKQMGKEGRIGGIIRDPNNKAFTITGLIKDYVYNDMYAAAAPLILFDQPSATGILTIRFKPGVNLQDALAKAGAIVKADNPGHPFEYLFVDDDFNQLFKTETLTGTLAGVFASLAIFISCLGLFGLAAYTAERRIKEIGIRKVLGATVSGLAGLLSKDFLKLVGIACLIAFPVALWAINNWLQSYKYRVNINWGVFAMAGIMAMLIALATVSFQAVKAALMNPVKSLRSE